MEAVGLLLLVAAVLGAEDADCPVTNLQCYKKTTQYDEDFNCEWKDREHVQGATYSLFIQSTSTANVSPETVMFSSRNLNVHVPLEYILTKIQSHLWVQRQIDNITCISNKTTVILDNLVKYSAPDIQKKVRSAGILTLSWPRVEVKKGAIHEIKWKKIDEDFWQHHTFETEDRKEVSWDSYPLQLQDHSVYQVEIRRKAKQYHLWSDWSNTVDVPVEIKAPVVRWREEKKERKRTIILRWDAPPPEASYGGVTYNLTLNVPCETKNKTTNKTSYTLTATNSEVRVSISAINKVSTSAFQKIIIPPVQHLKHCHTYSSTRLSKKRCLEWYQLIDGETRSTHMNTSTHATVESIKKGMEKFVRYYYFIHAGRNKHRHTKTMCPIYSEEGAPVAEPQNVTVINVTYESAVLSWGPIPVRDQRGFLLHYAVWISGEGSYTAYHEVPENQTSLLLRNLTTGSSYTVYIAGRTKAGAGPNSTANFLTNTTPFPVPNNGLTKTVLTVCGVSGVLLLLSVCFSVALKRLRRKLLPVIPRPVIPVTASYLSHQNLKGATEEVHDVTLLYHVELKKHSRCPNMEQSTFLQDCQLSGWEEEEEEDQEDENLINSFPNPNYKGQMLRLPESLEVADKSQQENHCDAISTPSYRLGSAL
ncbi:uncharacterized protein il12rb1 [Salminus brasiliensis]|uniref:uncharacterized protein il12rb1 n=1 Tax=Salminus brasiliensis TaxID=930266 RepID=UPI003B839BAD